LEGGNVLDLAEPIEPAARRVDHALRLDLKDALAKLPRAQAAVIRYTAAGYRQREIAAMLGVTQQAVSRTLHRARVRLRGLLGAK
jgi:RNA polymerase sigma factor (sigma-70 family)